jgi:Gnt-I system low-affinity gluconate transporter
LAVLISGFIVAIPVFFDVAFIILFPVIRSLANKIKKPILYLALPLLTGIAVTHSFIPPTPGPVAVADILEVDLGLMVGIGALIGFPVALVAALFISQFLVTGSALDQKDISIESEAKTNDLVGATIFSVLLPMVLMVGGAVINVLIKNEAISPFSGLETLKFISHPFTALILATLSALYFLGKKAGLDREKLFKISAESLAPAGTIILITGAGGVLKQMRISTGIGDMIAQHVAHYEISIVLMAYLVASLVRIMQGSATVAMITGAGIVAPILTIYPHINDLEKTLIALAIAAGSIIASHVNDSGFWLVNRYLKQEVTQTLRSWTIQSSIISVISFVFILLLFQWA